MLDTIAADFDTLRSFDLPDGGRGRFHALAALDAQGFGEVSRLPVSLRILLEAAIRNCDGEKVTAQHVRELAGWKPNGKRSAEVPLVPARILLQDLNGVPLIADLAAMRDAALDLGADPALIEPLVHVDMVIDHSVQVDRVRTPTALADNMRLEFERNAERYRFMKWGAQAFRGLDVVPPGVGICHQVNLERLSTGVRCEGSVYFPDTVVCPDSHTTMINGVGILGWGVGGIEVEAGMLGQPVYFLTPDVTGVELRGALAPGVTSTDVVLTITERLRQERVVGDFVEFFGDGAAALSVPTRATIANMAPEYGAFIGFFPMDGVTLRYFHDTNRPTDVLRAYMEAQGLLGMPSAGEIDYSRVIAINLSAIVPCIAGPRRPQDRIALTDSRRRFEELLCSPAASGGFALHADELQRRVAVDRDGGGSSKIGHGDVLIAAITSCTNTSNPAAMIAAGLLARKAVSRGLHVAPHIRTSMAPGSRAVTDYLRKADLLEPLSLLGFDVVAYGCTTCIGNSGPLDPEIERTIDAERLIGCAVLSGNRNFEARVHGSIKANFLASPALVVAFAIAGTMRIDLSAEPLGLPPTGVPVLLEDIWPTDDEVEQVIRAFVGPDAFEAAYAPGTGSGAWDDVPTGDGTIYGWPDSTYLTRPPFFADFSLEAKPPRAIAGARALAVFGDSLTTDHISPAGEIRSDTPAGRYLQDRGVAQADFNTYGARRGNHEIMMRGTFANRRIKNHMFPPRNDGSREEGGRTVYWPRSGAPNIRPIYDAAMAYGRDETSVVVFGGEEYGTGSARDWAAKGTRLLGVDAVIVSSFERIHRSNLVLMGVLPLEFAQGFDVRTLGINGSETFDVVGIDGNLDPQQSAILIVHRADGSVQEAPLKVRLDTKIEVSYYTHGGIVPYVLRKIFKNSEIKA